MLFGKYLNKYYIRYGLLFIISICTLIWVDYVQVEIPGYLANVCNAIKNGGSDMYDIILKNSLLTIHVAGQMFIGRMLWRYTLFYASLHMKNDLRHDMFVKAERLPVEYYHDNKVGNIMALFTNDLDTLEEFIGFGTVMLVDAIFLGLITSIQMFRTQWQIAILCFLPLLLIVFWGAMVEKVMTVKWETRQKNNDELYDFSQESFTGIRVIKAFVKENQQLHAFAKIAKKNKDFNISYAKISVIFDIIIEIIIAIVFALLIGLGGAFVLICKDPEATKIMLFGTEVVVDPGKFIEFIGYMDILIWPLIALGQVVTSFTRAKASLKRITVFLDTPENVKNPDNAFVLEDVKGEISFKNFFFQYPDAKQNYLKDISLTIKNGERVGIVGRIGSGKTTLVNILMRIYNLNKGQVFIDGHDLMDCDIQSIRRCIAYVPQDNFLFSDKIKNNISFSDSSLSDEEIIKAAQFSSVHDDIMEFKDQYDTVSGERGVTLSGGQKQRISIARAYAKNAPILIMDDSVSAVDVKTEENILKNIAEERKGKTTLVVASRISTVQHLDKIIVLADGQLVAFDTPANLEKNCELYQKMVYLQKLQQEVEGKEVA